MDFPTQALLWAQAPAVPSPSLTPLLPLRRWCYGLTLSPPTATPSAQGIVAFCAGLGLLFVVVLIAQGPTNTIRQLFDLPGHSRLIRSAAGRVGRASRLLMVAITMTVLSWTAGESLLLGRPSGLQDLQSLNRTRSHSEIALEQGALATLTPLRDAAGLADNLPWLVLAAFLVFRISIEPQAWTPQREGDDVQTHLVPRHGFTTAVWGSAALYALYRLIGWGTGNIELPLGSILVVETVLVPVVMLTADGFLLAWLLVELRDAGEGRLAAERFDASHAVALLPGAALACLVALPARYVATFVLLVSSYLPTWVSSTVVGQAIRWQLGWGLSDLQAASLCLVGLAGATAWSRGGLGESVTGYARMLKADGARVLVVLALAGGASGVLSAAAYAIVLLMPAHSWVLPAADAYAHFATFPIGLWTLAALIELGERSLPLASLADSADSEVPIPLPDQATAETTVGVLS